MNVIRDINLSFVNPPIPDRSMDWQAIRTGYDEGDPIGRGRTPAVALADLLMQEDERSQYVSSLQPKEKS